MKQGNSEKSIATLRRALQRDPDDVVPALFDLGMALDDVDQASEALELLQPHLLPSNPVIPAHGWHCAWRKGAASNGTRDSILS